VLTRAAQLWQASQPHAAIALLMEAGFTQSERQDFVHVAARRSRERFQRVMTRYTT
jgi:hypothetical protein